MESKNFAILLMGVFPRLVCVVALVAGSQLTVASMAAASESPAVMSSVAANLTDPQSAISSVVSYSPPKKDGPERTGGSGTR